MEEEEEEEEEAGPEGVPTKDSVKETPGGKKRKPPLEGSKVEVRHAAADGRDPLPPSQGTEGKKGRKEVPQGKINSTSAAAVAGPSIMPRQEGIVPSAGAPGNGTVKGSAATEQAPKV